MTHLIYRSRYYTACGQTFHPSNRLSTPTTAPDKVDCKACRRTRAFRKRVREIERVHREQHG